MGRRPPQYWYRILKTTNQQFCDSKAPKVLINKLKQLKNVHADNINNQLNEAKYSLNLIINAKRILKKTARKIYIFGHDIHSQVKKMKEPGVGQHLDKNGISSFFKKVLDDHEQQLETETTPEDRITSRTQFLVDANLAK